MMGSASHCSFLKSIPELDHRQRWHNPVIAVHELGGPATAVAPVALAAWPRGGWPSELERSLEQAAAYEPNHGVRERMQKALRGEPLSA